MSSSILQARLRANIAAAIGDAATAGSIQHAVSKGTFREIAVQNLLRPLLRSDLGITSGVLVDSDGVESPQVDVIVYSSRVLPPLMVQSISCVPVEACLQVFEIKSTLTKSELVKSVEAAVRISKLHCLPPGPADALQVIQGRGSDIPIRVPTIFSIFAFGTDLLEGGKSEWERLGEVLGEVVEPADSSRVLVHDLCVVGRGHWLHGGAHRPPTNDHDEVASQLLHAADSWPIWMGTRGMVPFLAYFRDR